MKKIFSFLAILAVVFTFSNLTNAEPESDVTSVIDSAWDQFGLFSSQIDETDSTIWIEMDKSKSEQELRKYLKENLPQTDLNKYKIEIITRDLEEVKNEHERSLGL
ncbi:hypothetical protein [Peribacillus simplex]|uniref:hypothetical protein n=1 Tax=Peribacillus simplex TaxID=1478 RepID=UPI003D2C43E5